MSTSLTQPSISIILAITPSRFSIAPAPPPEIKITATSHYEKPMTIFTHSTVFNIHLSQWRGDFVCHDITTENVKPVRVALRKQGKRRAFSRESGGRDDRYFVTLNPDSPVEFEAPFYLANYAGDPTVFEPGHKYRFALEEGQTVDWWRVGKKEDVMTPAGDFAGLGEASGSPIPLKTESVHIEVV